VSMTAIRDKLAAGQVVFLDGATGTELERRGVPMDAEAWCALASGTHPQVLRAVHEDYIRAGADVIIVNTFASARHLLEAAGVADRTESLARRSVAIARQARERAAGGRAVAIAGSLSHMVPLTREDDRYDPARVPDEPTLARNFRELAELLADAGCDLLLLEMMSHPVRARLARDDALATGLPVWLGFSARIEGGHPVSFVRDSVPFEEVVDAIIDERCEAAGVMHSDLAATEAALEVLRERWSGPLMAYPESGYFKMPNWQFVDIIAPDDFAERCHRWAEHGVKILGGCCGVGVEHIEAMIERVRDS